MEKNLDEITKSITQFKIPGWTKLTTDQIKVTTIGDGYINTTLKVAKVTSDCNNNCENQLIKTTEDEPKNILVKKYGGNIFDDQAKDMLHINSPMVQSLIFYEQSKRSWGPKLYGILENGRVEELVDCHTLTSDEAFTPEINRDMARAYARFHSLDLPINREQYDILASVSPKVEGNKKQLLEFINSSAEETEAIKSFRKLLGFSFEEELKWVNTIRSKIRQRSTLCTMDPNYLNRLVRNEKPSDPNETRTLIIDFDLSRYSDRGYDLGGHFATRIFHWGGKETKSSGLPFPSEAERVFFLTTYLEESKKLLPDFDKSSLDSLDNLMLETEVNAFVFIISILMMGMKLTDILDKQPAMATFIDPAIKLYRELKEEFNAKHPNLVVN